MGSHSLLSNIRARFSPTLDPEFIPISLVLKKTHERIANGTPSVELTFSLERLPGDRSIHKFTVPDPKNDESGEIKRLVERICKFLLWQQGASLVGIHSSDGSNILAKYLSKIYNENGPRAFDADMMKKAYGTSLVFESLDSCKIEASDKSKAIGGHLDGCRIGFDLGASDYKLAAVQNGEPVYTTEIPWDPRVESNPDWHRNKINKD